MNEQGEFSSRDNVIRAHQLCTDIVNVMMLINSSHDVEEIFHGIVEKSYKAIGSDSARIAMREGDKWLIKYVNKLPDDLIGRSFTDEDLSHAALAMTTKKAVAIDDAFHDDRTNNGMMESLGIKSVLVLPLIEKNVVIGTLLFGYHSSAVSFTDTEIDYAEIMAMGVTIALENARLYQDLEESKRLGDALNAIDTVLYSTQDYDAIMNSMLQLATEAIGAETAVIFSKEGERWTVRYEYKLPVSLLGQNFSNTEVRHMAITAETKRSFVAQDVVNNPDIDQKFVEMLGIRSLLDFPLILKGEVIGDLTFHYHSSPVPFNERQIDFARKLQISISLALENNRLLDTSNKSEARLKEAEKLGKFGYFNYDVHTRKITWSEGVFHIFGRDPVLGEPTVEEFFDLYSVDPGLEAMRGLVVNGEINEFDAKIKHDDHSYLFHFVVRSLKDDRGDFVAFFGTLHDIAEQKQAETVILKLSHELEMRNLELEDKNKELEAFVNSISHDLRAPVRHMSGFARILLENYAVKLDDQGKDYLKHIQRGSDKMTKLIDDLLNLARLSRQEAKRTAIDMSALAASVVAELREGDPVRSVEISMENGLIASADQSLTEIVLSNLIGNAWKFTSKTAKARIELGTIEKDGKTVYYVKDNGAGFNPQYAATMFQPFRRLHSGEEFEGTGIGLAIVERIIRKHDGKVWAEGEVGKGATVYFNLG
jgi:signal transduction histidine kinase/GAF domain-containing protein